MLLCARQGGKASHLLSERIKIHSGSPRVVAGF